MSSIFEHSEKVMARRNMAGMLLNWCVQSLCCYLPITFVSTGITVTGLFSQMELEGDLDV